MPLPLACLLAALLERPARAERVSTAELQARMEALIPQVAAASERPFFERPQLDIASRQEVLDVDAAIRKKYLDDDGGADAWTRQIVGRAVAIYLPSTATIYVIREAVERLFEVHEHSAALLRPALDCLIAHELTHALQDQQLPMLREEDPAKLGNFLVMREGQANLIMHDLCRDPATLHLLAAVQGVDSLSSQDPADPDLYAYGYGERFTRALRDRYGSGGLWWDMAQPPPSREEVLAVVSPSLLAGWQDPAPLAAAGALLAGRGDWSASAGPMSAFTLSEALAEDVREGGGPTAEAGLCWEAEAAASRRVTLVAFAMTDAEAAAGWVSHRRAQLQAFLEHSGDLHLLSPGLSYLDRLRLTERAGPRVGGLAVTAFGQAGGERYAEQWVASGRRLFGVAVTDLAVSLPALARSTQQLLLALPEPEAPGLPAQASLARWAPPADLPPPTLALDYQLRAAVWDSERSAWASCGARALEAGGLSGVARDPLLVVGYDCALRAGDLGAAERIVGLLPADAEVPVGLRLEHARQLLDSHRVAEAERILAGIPSVEPALQEQLASLRLWLAGAKHDHRAMAKAALDPSLPASVRLQAGTFLLHLGRWSDAAAILRITCPELSGAERARCEAAYEDARP